MYNTSDKPCRYAKNKLSQFNNLQYMIVYLTIIIREISIGLVGGAPCSVVLIQNWPNNIQCIY